MINPTHYTYTIKWSRDDNEYVGLCAEFPSLSFMGKNSLLVFVGIGNLVEGIIKDMKENGEDIPTPLEDDSASFSSFFLQNANFLKTAAGATITLALLKEKAAADADAAASKVLRSKSSSKAVRTAAGSALRQRPNKKK